MRPGGQLSRSQLRTGKRPVPVTSTFSCSPTGGNPPCESSKAVRLLRRPKRDQARRSANSWMNWQRLLISSLKLSEGARSRSEPLSGRSSVSTAEKDVHYFAGEARQQWLAKIHAIKLAELTPFKVQQWKREFLARAGSDPTKLRTARISVNSLIRRAKSLFAPDTIRHLQTIGLPDPLPFAGVSFEPRVSQRYQSAIDIEALIALARNELQKTQPELFKVFILATFCGLRRLEIDRLSWNAFRFDAGILRIQATKHFSPKTEGAIGDVVLEPELSNCSAATTPGRPANSLLNRPYAAARGSLRKLPGRAHFRKPDCLAAIQRRRDQNAVTHVAKRVRFSDQSTPWDSRGILSIAARQHRSHKVTLR